MEIKIGSFNMKNWGYTSRKDFQKIAEIIIGEEFDIVALQEILSEGKGVQRMLDTAVKRELYDWEVRFGFPSESSDSEKNSEMVMRDKRGEGYAFLWNKKHFKIAEYKKIGQIREFKPRIINSLQNDVNVDCSIFARTPYYIRLQPVFGGFFELRLINIHIYFGSNSFNDILKRKIEYRILTRHIYPDIATQIYGNHRTPYTIAMGDYNLNLMSALSSPSNPSASIDEVLEEVMTVQAKLTTLSVPNMSDFKEKKNGSYANNYDHFTYSLKTSPFQSITYDRVDAIEKYCGGDFCYYRDQISDHLPISMTVTI